ncbi:MAG TPA: sugar ABC transporter permease [Pseudolysinimonas sp.]|jgi:raffinose/stachyose/melibiose transport system permease protein
MAVGRSGARLRTARPRLGFGRRFEPIFYLLPALIVFAVFVIVPLGQGIWLSLFNWDGLSPATWAGFDNYAEIVLDPDLRSGFLHSAYLVIFWTVIPIILGLFLAAVLSSPRMRGVPFARAIIFLPQIIPLVAVSIVWRWVLEPEGPINTALRAVGLGAFARGWLGDYNWSLTAIGAVACWVVTGFCMVLFLAGIQNISTELYDAAKVDGASGLQQFIHVTLPGLRQEIAVAVVVTVISALRAFDLVYVMTGGGPGNSSTVPGWQVYRRAFFYGEIGSASALGVTLAIVILIVVFALTRLGRRSADDE